MGRPLRKGKRVELGFQPVMNVNISGLWAQSEPASRVGSLFPKQIEIRGAGALRHRAAP